MVVVRSADQCSYTFDWKKAKHSRQLLLLFINLIHFGSRTTVIEGAIPYYMPSILDDPETRRTCTLRRRRCRNTSGRLHQTSDFGATEADSDLLVPSLRPLLTPEGNHSREDYNDGTILLNLC